MKNCSIMRESIKKLSAEIVNDDVKKMFDNCFFSTLNTTTEHLDDGTTYVFTGDISAMWLRDSASQVTHYLPFCKKDNDVSNMVKGLILKQAQYILIDPYANSFNKTNSGAKLHEDFPPQCGWVWEQKYELDSLCYFFDLALKFYSSTQDTSVFNGTFLKAAARVMDIFEIEQHHDSRSGYSFSRIGIYAYDTLENNGKGSPTAYTGMVWSGFRPSDDRCTYHYLIPSNCFAARVLTDMTSIFEMLGHKDMAKRASRISGEIKDGIKKYGIIETEQFGKIYAYETDGIGNYNLMDDANVPSLLSLPLIGWCNKDDEIYLNTRKFCLSKANPFYYEGKAANGIGSPHTPKNYIWHIALIVQALTSTSASEREQILETLTNTHDNKFRMHEGFDKDNPSEFTREWFAWADSLFALFVLEYYKLIK